MITFIVVVDQRLPVRLAVHLPAVVKLEFLPEVELLHLYGVSRLSLQSTILEAYHLLVYALVTLLPTDVGFACL